MTPAKLEAVELAKLQVAWAEWIALPASERIRRQKTGEQEHPEVPDASNHEIATTLARALVHLAERCTKLEAVANAATAKVIEAVRDACTFYVSFEYDDGSGERDRFNKDGQVDRFLAALAALDAKEQPDDTSRCAVCGWPLQLIDDDGCVRGNCSMRPRPERMYSPERADRESTNVDGRAAPMGGG